MAHLIKCFWRCWQNVLILRNHLYCIWQRTVTVSEIKNYGQLLWTIKWEMRMVICYMGTSGIWTHPSQKRWEKYSAVVMKTKEKGNRFLSRIRLTPKIKRIFAFLTNGKHMHFVFPFFKSFFLDKPVIISHICTKYLLVSLPYNT